MSRRAALGAGLTLLAVVSLPSHSDVRALTGRELLTLCETPGGEDACATHFRGEIARAARAARPGRRAACVPPGFGSNEALALFRIEAERFPDVLHLSAQRLTRGMLLKFFPCAAT